MDIAKVYDWFAEDSRLAAERTDDPREREILLKLSLLWAAAAQQSRDEESSSTQHCGGGNYATPQASLTKSANFFRA